MKYSYNFRPMEVPFVSIPNDMLDLCPAEDLGMLVVNKVGSRVLRDVVVHGYQEVGEELNKFFTEFDLEDMMLSAFNNDYWNEGVVEEFDISPIPGEPDIDNLSELEEWFCQVFLAYDVQRLEMNKDTYADLYIRMSDIFDNNGDMWGIETVTVDDIPEGEIVFRYINGDC